MIRTVRVRPRPGFTVVELLVAAAICVVIMTILATCFQISIDTMRHMRSTGEMADQLRAAADVMREDLRAKHFPESVDPNDPANKREYVRDHRLDRLFVDHDTSKPAGAAGKYTVRGWAPPTAGGFFRVYAPEGTQDGVGSDSLASTRATNHYLHFTSLIEEKVNQRGYSATVTVGSTPTTFHSTAAEIAYFLDPQPRGETAPGGEKYYQLIRRQRLAARTPGEAAALPATDAGVVSLRKVGSVDTVNSLADLVNPANRLGGSTRNAPETSTAADDSRFAPLSSAARLGDDVLLSNVLSFEVKLNWTTTTVMGANPPLSNAVAAPRAFNALVDPRTSDAPFDYLPKVRGPGNNAFDPATDAVFDTWTALANWDALDQKTGEFIPSAAVPPTPIRVTAIQIRLRVWDPKVQQARQMTIVQEL